MKKILTILILFSLNTCLLQFLSAKNLGSYPKYEEPFINLLLPTPKNGGFKLEGYWVWDGSIIKGEDGKWHMFASAWKKNVPFHPNWVTNSRVVRAVADKPEGPYIYVEDVLPPRGGQYFDAKMTHNPTIHKSGDTYLLFYTGTTYDAEIPTTSAPKSITQQARANQRLGLATAKSIKGPWSRSNKPILEPRQDYWDSLLTTNAAAWVEDDGTILMLYKSATKGKKGLKYGVAKAKDFKSPFQRLSDTPIKWTDDPDLSYEDAYVWKENTLYHMLFKDMGSKLTGEYHAGVHAISNDGINWRLAKNPKAYSRNLKWDDGSTTKQGSLERVQVLLIDGKPSFLAFATTDGEQPWQQAKDTFTIVVPLKK